MDYISRIEYIKKNIIIHFSQFGFGIQCKYAICNRIQGTFPDDALLDMNIIKTLQNNDKIYINCHIPNIETCIHLLIDYINTTQIKICFLIMGEPIIPKWIVTILKPYATTMFLQNNVYNEPNIYNMPIGIRDGEEVFTEHLHFSGYLLVNEITIPRKKEYLCLLCFSYTHEERRICEKILGNKDFVINLNSNCFYNGQPSFHCGKVPVWINYEYTHKSYYTLCPTGVGQATHRFFEAIFLHSIPIVKRTNTVFDKLYNIFPCIIVDNWNDVTFDLLENNIEIMTLKMKSFHVTYPNILRTSCDLFDFI